MNALTTTLLAICLAIPFAKDSSQQNLTIMTFNVRNCRGMDDKLDYIRTAKAIHGYRPDIVAIQELDSVTARSSRVDVLKKIAGLTSYGHTYAPAITFDGGKYGIGALHKEQPFRSYNIPLPGSEELRTLQVIEFSTFVLFNAHLSLTESDRDKSGEIINQEKSKFTKPVFLCGDFNAEPGSTLIKLLKRNWTQLSPDANTFPASVPDVQLDYIFVSSESASSLKVMSAEVVKDSTSSDHRPVVVKLNLTLPLRP
ncbi:MAG: metallophosphoesterase [Chitinophagaceae bacterium]|nr:MAG: metallophosphoesterase [Chitinophagaceae bacterium]